MGNFTQKWYGRKWVKTAKAVKLPEAASEGMMSSRNEMDGLLLTMAPAHTTAVAAQGIDKGDFAGRSKTDGPKLAGRNT
jgi:hypothetical protein